MATQPIDRTRRELEEEYRTWARICEDKHGNPWPIHQDEIANASDQDLMSEVKKLKLLGRTPHE
jgi:hypothetical protein